MNPTTKEFVIPQIAVSTTDGGKTWSWSLYVGDVTEKFVDGYRDQRSAVRAAWRIAQMIGYVTFTVFPEPMQPKQYGLFMRLLRRVLWED